MTRRHSLLLVGILLTLCVGGLTRQPDVKADAAKLPAKLTDRQFWSLSSDLSEPNGSFRSDNLLSNEIFLQYVIPDLVHTARTERVYLGVGPEQNFTYITALRPRMAFIVDVRRGNLQLHLMYKALFELSKDRVEFVSRLFSKPRPEGLDGNATVRDIFAAYAKVDTSEVLYKENLLDIQTQLLKKRKLPLSVEDLKGIEYVYHAFYWHGPVIQVLVVDRRPWFPRRADLLRPDGGRRREGAVERISGVRGELPVPEGPAHEESAGADRRGFCRIQSAAIARQVSQGT